MFAVLTLAPSISDPILHPQHTQGRHDATSRRPDRPRRLHLRPRQRSTQGRRRREV